MHPPPLVTFRLQQDPSQRCRMIISSQEIGVFAVSGKLLVFSPMPCTNTPALLLLHAIDRTAIHRHATIVFLPEFIAVECFIMVGAFCGFFAGMVCCDFIVVLCSFRRSSVVQNEMSPASESETEPSTVLGTESYLPYKASHLFGLRFKMADIWVTWCHWGHTSTTNSTYILD
ncbi:unnamed protein product [Pseudo-nitzschia multistriata]|uniref:Uncharacterized protein n=1 Tax=Pseudo-nitzschia multistriata TaxID=183589 RepID=A0A448ZM09_9STRA|nr:unnamed protein product [Pseudo-nitzschia multistriata]